MCSVIYSGTGSLLHRLWHSHCVFRGKGGAPGRPVQSDNRLSSPCQKIFQTESTDRRRRKQSVSNLSASPFFLPDSQSKLLENIPQLCNKLHTHAISQTAIEAFLHARELAGNYQSTMSSASSGVDAAISFFSEWVPGSTTQQSLQESYRIIHFALSTCKHHEKPTAERKSLHAPETQGIIVK